MAELGCLERQSGPRSQVGQAPGLPHCLGRGRNKPPPPNLLRSPGHSLSLPSVGTPQVPLALLPAFHTWLLSSSVLEDVLQPLATVSSPRVIRL